MNETLQQIDQILKRLSRELWIVTAAANGQRGGLTATWVSAASIDAARPVLLIGIAENHFTCELISSSRSFAVHLLREDQGEIAWNFARDSGRERDKFTDVSCHRGTTGSPILIDCLAWLEGRVIGEYSAGERRFFWGEVIRGESLSSGQPLTDQVWLRHLPESHKQLLAASRMADIELQRPLHQAWVEEQANGSRRT